MFACVDRCVGRSGGAGRSEPAEQPGPLARPAREMDGHSSAGHSLLQPLLSATTPQQASYRILLQPTLI